MAKKDIAVDRLKAAEKYANNNSRRWNEDGDIYYDHSKIMDAFIAGAEWQQEQSCDTCTNDKGCVTCKDGELWEGKEQSSEWEGQRTWIEQPSEELEREIKRYGKEEMPVVLESDLNDIARHFYELGKQSREPVNEDLEEAAKEYATTHLRNNEFPTADNAFIAGAEWQKEQMGEQARKELSKTDITLADLVAFDEGFKLGKRLERQDMLKDAVEGMITCANLNRYILVPKLDESLTYGHKVKIVIIPDKEDEK